MPYAKIQITREPNTTPELKAEHIRQVTESIANVLDKDRERTYVLIEEIEPDNWGIAGVPTTEWRRRREASN